MTGFNGRIGHLDGIESPWGNAGGVVKTIEDNEIMAKTGVGWIEDGSHCLQGRPGNAIDPEHPELGASRVVYTHNPETGETVNSLGMPGKGMDMVETEIPEKVRIAEASGKRHILNVAPVSDNPVEECQELVARGYAAGAHAVLVNAGCPNVVMPGGGRHELLSRNGHTLWHVLSGLTGIVENYRPIFVRISPQETFEKARDIFSVIRDSGVVSAVFTPNTWPGFVPTDKAGQPILQVPGGAGGRSGPATADASAEQTRWAVELLKGSGIDVISSSGINNARELQRRLGLGAVGCAGTTFYYESVNGWADDTNRLLQDLAS